MYVSQFEYSKSFTEVLTVLKYIPKEQLNKIPKDILQILNKNYDKNYIYELDFSKNFGEQNISKIALAILSIFYQDYWANETQKNKIIQKDLNERNSLEEEKRKVYDPNVLFLHGKNKINENHINNTKDTSLIKVDKKFSFFKNLFLKFKQFIHKYWFFA